MSEEIVIRDHYSDIVEAEVKFKVNRELDKMDKEFLKNEVLGLVLRVGPALYARQLHEEEELYDLEEREERMREEEELLRRTER